jgi:hypothetical protein
MGSFAHRVRWIAWVASSLLLFVPAPLRADEGARAATEDSAYGLGLSLGVRGENGNHRIFHQLEPTTGEVRTYKARVYGGVGVTVGYERSFGPGELAWSLSADYWRSLFFSSGARRLGEVVDTTAQRMSVVAGLSLHPADSSRRTYGWLLAGVGAMRFEFDLPSPDSADDEAIELATGDYDYASIGFAGRLPLSPLALSARGSYLVGFHTGQYGSRAIENQPHGFDALAALEYGVLPWLDLSLQGGVTMLWLRLKPLPARRTDAPAEVQDSYFVLGLAAKARL